MASLAATDAATLRASTVTSVLLDTWRSHTAVLAAAREQTEELSRFENEGGAWAGPSAPVP